MSSRASSSIAALRRGRSATAPFQIKRAPISRHGGGYVLPYLNKFWPPPLTSAAGGNSWGSTSRRLFRTHESNTAIDPALLSVTVTHSKEIVRKFYLDQFPASEIFGASTTLSTDLSHINREDSYRRHRPMISTPSHSSTSRSHRFGLSRRLELFRDVSLPPAHTTSLASTPMFSP